MEKAPRKMSSATVSCHVIRGRAGEDGKRTSIALFQAEVVNTPPTKKLIPASMDMTGIKVVNVVAHPSNVSDVRISLTDPTTPTPNDHGLQFCLYYNSDNFARSNPNILTSNDTGSVAPVQSPFSLAGLVPPEPKEDELTVVFINQLPSAYSAKDRPEIQTVVMNDEFAKFQSKRSTLHVVLYISPAVHAVYTSLVKDFDTYWKKVVDMESFFYFTNDCCGKKLIDAVQPVHYSLTANTSFKHTFIFLSPRHAHQFDQIKRRKWDGDYCEKIDFVSTKEKAFNTVAMCVDDPVDTPFKTVMLTNALGDQTAVSAVDIELAHPVGDMIDLIVLNDKKDTLKTRQEKHAFVTENMPFILSMKMKGILAPYFSLKYDTESVEQLFEHLCLVVCPSFYDWLSEFDNAEHKAMLRLLTGQKPSALPPHPRFFDNPIGLVNTPSLAR
jgi:hypothetical protein